MKIRKYFLSVWRGTMVIVALWSVVPVWSLNTQEVEAILEQFKRGDRQQRLATANHFFQVLGKEDFTDETVVFDKKTHPDTISMNMWFWSGEWLLANQEYRKAVACFEQALPFVQHRQHLSSKSDILNELSLSWFRLANYFKAAEYAKQCYDIDRQLGDEERMCYSLNVISSIYLAARQPAEAEKYNQDVIDIAKRLNKTGLLATRYGLAAEIKHLMGRTKEAVEYAQKAIDLDSQLGNKAKVAVHQVQLAAPYLTMDRFDEVVDMMKEAIPVLQEAGNGSSLGIGLNRLGEALLRQGKITEAVNNFNRAVDIFQQTGDQYNESFAHYQLYEALAATQPAMAADHMKAYAEIKDSLYQNDMRNLLADYDAAYKNAELAQENKDIHQRTQTILIVTAVMLVLILTIVAFLLYVLRLRSRAAQLQRNLQTARSLFFTNITHELRTPLTVIEAATEDIRRETQKDDIIRKTDIIEQHSQSLLTLINQILDISKLSASLPKQRNLLGGTASEQSPWRTGDIVGFINMICESYSHYAEHLGLSLQYASHAPEITMDFIPDYMRKIMRNLISNALKFSENGDSIYIHTQTDGHRLQLIVRDEGVGIEPEQVEHIFEPFYQAPNDSGNIGTGVGLSLTRLAVENMDGEIEVHSAPGEGTIFIVTLPLRHGKTSFPPVNGEEKVSEKVDLPSEKPELIDSSGDDDNVRRILIVEDSAEVARYMSR
ncbi:MAG: hypothetical protein IJV27_07535 [Prevotella sp.]|nr:hypothetical protein [Prevotella sp.]